MAQRKAEIRSLEFGNTEIVHLYGEQKGLEEERAEILEEMKNIVNTAKKEKRALNDNDNDKYAELREKVLDIDIKLGKIESYRSQSINQSNKQEHRALDNSILPNEKIEKRSYQDKSNNMDFGKLIRGMAGKGWENASKEYEHYRAMQSADNSTLIPQALADRIVDIARTQSAVFGKIPVVPMEHNNLTIAVQTKDAKANFVNEGDLIPSSEALFKPCTLTGKTLAIFVPISEQLLDTANNLGNQLMNSCSQAIALALDESLIYGAGLSTEENGTHKIKGISLYDGINKITHQSREINYDFLIKGIKACKDNNIEPTNIVYNTNVGSDLAMLKDSNGQYIVPPKVIDKYISSESNNIKDNECYIYNSDYLILGLQQGIKAEWGYSADQFQRIQKGLRIYLRADLGVLNEKAVTQVKYQQVTQ